MLFPVVLFAWGKVKVGEGVCQVLGKKFAKSVWGRSGEEKRRQKKAVNPKVRIHRLGDTILDQPQVPEPHDPELHPPPPMGLDEVIPNPERGPASTNSTVMVPQVFINPSSTKNFRASFSYTLSLSFGSSRANPNEGPAQPPCIKAIRRAESILFCSRYSLSLTTAWSVTVKSDMKSSCGNISG